jgi:hypothetical protein
MTANVKFFLWFLGASAALNIAADVWFRLAVSASTTAPWYVWAPVVGTVAIALITLAAGAVAKRLRKRPAEPDEPVLAEPAEPHVVLVESPTDDCVLPAADATERAASFALRLLGDKFGGDWSVLHCSAVLQVDGRRHFSVLCPRGGS